MIPRPSQPLIRISLSPDDLSEYKDLFTRPPPQDSDVTPSTTPPPTSTSRLPKLDPPIYPRQGQTPAGASVITAAHRQATSDGDRSPTGSRSSRKNSDSDKGQQTQGPSGAPSQECRQATTDSLQRHPSFLTSHMNPPNRIRSNLIRSGPPSMPLPQTPVPSALFPLALPRTSNTDSELKSTSVQKPVTHPHASVVGSAGNSPPKLPADQPTPNLNVPTNFDIDHDTAPALQLQVQTALTGMPNVREVMEVTKLEKRVLTLEKEVARKDKELKGLRWIINNWDSSPNKQQPVSFSPSSSTSSLSPPSPSINMSSLSAIPEVPPSTLQPTPSLTPSRRYDSPDQRTLGASESHRSWL